MITSTMLGQNGRFGNQMFQYATLYALANDLNYEFGVPYQNKNTNEYYHFCLPDCFSLSAKEITNQYFLSLYLEPHFNYDPNIKNIPDNTNLKGYFQSEKYFKKYKQQFKTKEYKFKQEIDDQANNFLNNRDCELISVHIRLGDYVHIADSHPVCTPDYYLKAFECLPKDCNIMLFSDDYGLALNLFKNMNINIFACGTNNKFVDMCLMTKCDYHVIANSSFSWWGAWLSNSKKIIAPKQWFGPAAHMPKNWDDVYADDWTVI